MNSQVTLNPTPLSILSIPRAHFWLFAAPVLQLLHREAARYSASDDLASESESSDSDSGHGPRSSSKERLLVDNSSKPAVQGLSPHISSLSTGNESDVDADDNHLFHVAFLPTECTVVCSESLMETLFHESLQVCKQLHLSEVELVNQSFLHLQIDSDEPLRILELTQPLSENNIPLFFLSSHFSDIVLIPSAHKDKVITILTKHNFQFSDISNSYIVTTDQEESPIQRTASAVEHNTFALFEEWGIQPQINRKSKLLLTGARSGETINTIHKAAALISANEVPDYFAITRTSVNEISLILPKSARQRAAMGFRSSHIIGSAQDVIIPITIDLTKLPMDSTGIVAGLASRIFNGVHLDSSSLSGPFEMNYLSMARSAVVMVPKENLGLVSSVLSQSVDVSTLSLE